jgi:hypothetical protein
MRVFVCCVVYAKAKSTGLLDSMHANVKFEELDGVLHKDWELRFNSIQRGKTYHGIDLRESLPRWG